MANGDAPKSIYEHLLNSLYVMVSNSTNVKPLISEGYTLW